MSIGACSARVGESWMNGRLRGASLVARTSAHRAGSLACTGNTFGGEPSGQQNGRYSHPRNGSRSGENDVVEAAGEVLASERPRLGEGVCRCERATRGHALLEPCLRGVDVIDIEPLHQSRLATFLQREDDFTHVGRAENFPVERRTVQIRARRED